jgi:hypothetical protein
MKLSVMGLHNSYILIEPLLNMKFNTYMLTVFCRFHDKINRKFSHQNSLYILACPIFLHLYLPLVSVNLGWVYKHISGALMKLSIIGVHNS